MKIIQKLKSRLLTKLFKEWVNDEYDLELLGMTKQLITIREDELKIYQKGFMSNAIKKAIKVFHSNDILIRGNYVVSPEYDNDDFKALAEYAYSHKVVYPGFTIISPMPGTIFYSAVKDQIIDYDLSKYNFFNCVLKTKLPLPKFYENIGHLWTIKEGKEVI